MPTRRAPKRCKPRHPNARPHQAAPKAPRRAAAWPAAHGADARDVVGDDMDVVELDDGLVEMSETSAADVTTKPTKQKAGKVKTSHEIHLDSDSEEEEVAIVSADHL